MMRMLQLPRVKRFLQRNCEQSAEALRSQHDPNHNLMSSRSALANALSNSSGTHTFDHAKRTRSLGRAELRESSERRQAANALSLCATTHNTVV
jgi:hypothetical protein